MRLRLALAPCVLLLACGGETQQEEAAPAAETPPAVAPAAAPAIALADVAGRWTVRTMPENSDSTLVTFDLNTTATTEGWTMVFEGQPPVDVHVLSVEADSIVTHAGPYPSALRPGVEVNVNSVWRMQNGMLMGRSIATYSAGPDSVLALRSEGTRAQ